MKQPRSQEITSSHAKSFAMVTISVLITTFIIGSGMYVWYTSRFSEAKESLEQDVDFLQTQLVQLQTQYTVEKNENAQNAKASQSLYELIGARCTSEECLFNQGNSDYPVGTAVVKGYFSPVERTAWEETQLCDSFTVTGGSQELIRAMVSLVDKGNTVHSKNDLNQPVINLGLGFMTVFEKQSILQSSKDNEIELLVLLDSPLESGVSVCFADATVLRVK